MDIGSVIREIPDFPQPGVLFRDITPLLANPAAFGEALDLMAAWATAHSAEAIVGVESRGFIFGAPLAAQLKLPFVPVRKPGKLPSAHMSVEYSLEYGTSQLDIHSDALEKGQRAFIIDDVLATGGTALATAKLVELIHGAVAGFGFLIEIDALGGRSQLEAYAVESLLHV